MATEILKLRMKIGEHEFEAEGPTDAVVGQIERWQRLAGLAAHDPPAALEPQAAPADPFAHLFAVDTAQNQVAIRVNFFGRQRNREAALLVLYGFRTYLPSANGGEIPAARVREALAASGYRIGRVDRVLEPHLSAGRVRKSTRKKREAYALTAIGEQYATKVLSTVARPR